MKSDGMNEWVNENTQKICTNISLLYKIHCEQAERAIERADERLNDYMSGKSEEQRMLLCGGKSQIINLIAYFSVVEA